MRHDIPAVYAERIRLDPWHRYSIYSVVILTTLSGVAWLILHYFISAPGQVDAISDPLEALSLKVHGAAAMLMLLCLGTLFLPHMLRAWRLGRNHYLGGLLAIINLVLILTGYALYYFSTEENHAIISAMHWVTGLLLPVILIFHILTGRRGRARG
ncbi:MAG TPA: DUF4405 domain-containing protein [Gammaproteobacteria bacterium]|nr:DUF4405 domain-containing protein [Gammaproteobacteria bacterium]